MNSKLWALVIVPFLMLAHPALANVPLVEPAPVAVPSDVSTEQLLRALKIAFVERGWMVTKEEPGRLEATLNVRKHMLQVEAMYDASQVTFAYLDSVNLDYEEKKGVKYIHRKYAGWMNNVVVGLRRAMLQAQS